MSKLSFFASLDDCMLLNIVSNFTHKASDFTTLCKRLLCLGKSWLSIIKNVTIFGCQIKELWAKF